MALRAGVVVAVVLFFRSKIKEKGCARSKIAANLFGVPSCIKIVENE